MSSQLKKIAQFHDDDKDKNSSFDSDYANRNEIKRIDNNSNKGFSSDFDKLNESLYKINNFLKLSKDIDVMKKETLVKNDIQRKLSLKSQWLNSNHGSTGSLNSLPPLKNSSGTASTQSLNKNAADEIKKKRKFFSNFKSQSVHNLNVANDKPRRLRKHTNHNSFDELNFVDKLRLSDEEISQLSQEPEFRVLEAKLKKFGGSSNSLKIETPKRPRSESVESNSKSGSQRDLSKYFPKIETKPKPQNVNKSQKELKDVDLSKYFLPTPVQELKSIPSPSQSPNLSRKSINQKPNDDSNSNSSNLLRTAMDNLQKMSKKPPIDGANQSSLPKKQFFTLHDQQLDGDVTLQIPVITTLNIQKAQKAAIITDDDCDAFFNSLKSSTENLDAIFNQVAADALPSTTSGKQKQTKEPFPNGTVPRSVPNAPKPKPKAIEPKPKPMPKPKVLDVPIATDRHKYTLDQKSETDILGKLSGNLLNEIKLLEQHLELNGKPIEDPVIESMKNLKRSEEELNNVINDIFNSPESRDGAKVSKPQPENKLPIKRNSSAVSKPKKVTHVNLAKSMRITKVDHKPPISGNGNANDNSNGNVNNKVERKTMEVKSFKTPTPAPRAKMEKIQINEQINNHSEKTNENAKVTKDEVDNVDGMTDIVSYSFKPRPVNDKVEEVTLLLPRKRSSSATPEPKSNRNSEEKSLPISKQPLLNNKVIESSKESNEFNGTNFHKSDLVANKPRTVSEVNLNDKEVALTSKPSFDDARKAYFAELNKQPPSSSRAMQMEYKMPEVQNENETVSTDSPPIKPARRRSRKSSSSKETVTDEIHESPVHCANLSNVRISAQQLAELSEPKYKNDIPELNNIARFLNSSENNNINQSKSAISGKHAIENRISPTPDKVSFDPVAVVDGAADMKSIDDDETPIRNRTDYQRAVRKSFGSGDYDNLPSTSRRAMFKETKATSKSFDIASETDRDYDNVHEKTPTRRLSFDKKRNVTDMLLERSKAIHNKKQDFINEKLVETNPYIRRMMEKEHRFHKPAYDRTYGSSIPSSASSHHDSYQPSYSHSVHRPTPTSALSSCISHTPRTATLPSSSSRSVLDLFSRPASSNNKDSCIIS